MLDLIIFSSHPPNYTRPWLLSPPDPSFPDVELSTGRRVAEGVQHGEVMCELVE